MNESAFIGWLVGGLSALAALALGIKKLLGGAEPRVISPQPLEVKASPEWAEKRELEALRVELIGRIESHERRNESDMGLIRGDLQVLRQGDGYVQRRLDGLTRVIYAIAGKMNISTRKTDAEEID